MVKPIKPIEVTATLRCKVAVVGEQLRLKPRGTSVDGTRSGTVQSMAATSYHIAWFVLQVMRPLEKQH